MHTTGPLSLFKQKVDTHKEWKHVGQLLQAAGTCCYQFKCTQWKRLISSVPSGQVCWMTSCCWFCFILEQIIKVLQIWKCRSHFSWCWCAASMMHLQLFKSYNEAWMFWDFLLLGVAHLCCRLQLFVINKLPHVLHLFYCLWMKHENVAFVINRLNNFSHVKKKNKNKKKNPSTYFTAFIFDCSYFQGSVIIPQEIKNSGTGPPSSPIVQHLILGAFTSGCWRLT